MKQRAEQILTAILILLLVPCVFTLLLSGRMQKIYYSIKNEADYISVKTGGGILDMELEEYVLGVAAAQIPSDYDIEALKAQMIVARTNIYRQIREQGSVAEEAYLTMEELERIGAAEKFLRAQQATEGKILMWEEEPILASFHAVSSGKTRNAREAFDSEDYPYLVSRACPSDVRAQNSERVIQIADSWADMEVVQTDEAGYVLQISADGALMSGEEFRSLLGLPSANFTVDAGENGVFLTVRGVGHGLGMSQYTAQQLALTGKNYKEILMYFYPGTEIWQE